MAGRTFQAALIRLFGDQVAKDRAALIEKIVAEGDPYGNNPEIQAKADEAMDAVFRTVAKPVKFIDKDGNEVVD